MDYRSILKSEFAQRCDRNSGYSLRAFARDLKIHPSRLSAVLNGKKGLSKDSAADVAKILGFTPREAEMFCDLVEATHARSAAARGIAQARVTGRVATDQNSNHLAMDAFRAIADWYHLAILQLMKLAHYREDFAWIAKSLDIQVVQVEDAFARMLRLELIMREGERHRPVDDYVISPDGIPSEAIRKFHEQILAKATKALVLQPVSERDFSAAVIPFTFERMPAAREKLRFFLKQFCEEFSSDPQADRVYSLSVQFVPMTLNEVL